MLDLEDFFRNSPYRLSKGPREALLLGHLRALHQRHVELCEPYHNVVASLFGGVGKEIRSMEDVPFLPVRLFKERELASVPKGEIFKTLTSSGTTSQTVSRIFIDKQTSTYQTMALANIVKDFLGPQRLPMLILDTESVIKDRLLFSARGGGILGMSNFGRDRLYLLDENMQLRERELEAFLEKHGQGEVFLFGFTFIAWQHLIKPLLQSKKSISIPKGILIHSGGWKKLVSESVDNATFKRIVNETTGVSRVFNFYGMVEQLGSVFMECEHGYFHPSHFSDVIARDPKTWAPARTGEQGVLQVISILPHSYPGHSLLTEDVGIVHGEDDCPCGRYGKRFTVLGRIPKAEARGCSDTYQAA